MDPNHIPFFDAKGAQISGLKARVKALSASASDPDKLEKISTLREEHRKNKKLLEDRETRLLQTTALDDSSIGRFERTLDRNETKEFKFSSPNASRNFSATMSGSISSPQLTRLSPMSAFQHSPEVDHNQESDPFAFHPPTTSPAKLRLKDPTAVLAVSTISSMGSEDLSKTGKRIQPMECTDWSRVGYGGDGPRDGRTLSAMEIDNSQRYMTTTGA